MDIQEFVKQTGEFLKAEFVKTSPETVYEISGEADLIENKFGNTRLHIPVKVGEKTFVFDCSKTNARVIAGLLGHESKKWVGKTIKLETYKTRTTEGKMTDAISVKEE